jgi:hypothetical protein
MAKQLKMQIRPQAESMTEQADAVYKIVDVVGVSEKSWEDAGRNAEETAAGSLRDLPCGRNDKADVARAQETLHQCPPLVQPMWRTVRQGDKYEHAARLDSRSQ